MENINTLLKYIYKDNPELKSDLDKFVKYLKNGKT